MIAKQAAPGLYVDCSAPTTAQTRAAIRDRGALGIGRYVPLPGVNPGADITGAELHDITADGMACFLVQHVRFPGWDPGAHDGAHDADAAVQAALRAGYPEGAHLWLDLEGISGSADATASFAYAWQAAVIAAGFKAGLYVGYQVPLSPEALYDLHGYTSYWHGGGGSDVAVRGYAIRQGVQVFVDGLAIDDDHVAPDKLGEVPYVAVAG